MAGGGGEQRVKSRYDGREGNGLVVVVVVVVVVAALAVVVIVVFYMIAVFYSTSESYN
jgi:flagellar basal body-associated protein FliL